MRGARLAVGVALAASAWLGASALAAWRVTAPVHWVLTVPAGLGVPLLPVSVRAPDGLRLAGWRAEPLSGTHPGAPVRGTAVLAHGYRSDRRQLMVLAPALLARGVRVLAFDFRGHGGSDGDRITLGAAEQRDVGAILDHAASYGAPVVYVGFSMGAASYLLSGREAVAAVLDSPYDALRHALRARLAAGGVPPALGLAGIALVGARLPVPLDDVRPVARVPGLARPTLFVFAGRDAWVPAASQARYRAAPCRSCTFLDLPGLAAQGHGDHFTPAWVERVAGFVAANLQAAPSGSPFGS